MVRLMETGSKIVFFVVFNFNSSMVRLMGKQPWLLPFAFYNFNSSMVRLMDFDLGHK